jgi:hypothetical protein
MDGSGWLPMVLIAQERGERRSRLAQAIFPTVLPGAGPQKAALGAMAAVQLVNDADRREVNTVREALAAAGGAVRNHGKLPPDDQLTAMPRLASALERAPDLRAAFDSVGKAAADEQSQLARAAIDGIKAGIELAKGTQFTKAQFAKLAIAQQLDLLPVAKRPDLGSIVK